MGGAKGATYADPRVRIPVITSLCLRGNWSLRIVGIGNRMTATSDHMFKATWAMAMLFRQTPDPRLRGLQPPRSRPGNVVVHATSVKTIK